MKRANGFTFIEIILATGLLSAVVGAAAYLVSASQQTTNESFDRQQAHSWAVDGSLSAEKYIEQQRENRATGTPWFGKLVPLSGTNNVTKSYVLFLKNSGGLKIWDVGDSKNYVDNNSPDTNFKNSIVDLSANNTEIFSDCGQKVIAGVREFRSIKQREEGAQQFRRYITASEFDPSNNSGSTPAPACTKNYYFENNIQTIDKQKPYLIDNTSGASAGNVVNHQPIAIKIISTVTWGKGQLEEQEKVETIYTDWSSQPDE